MPLNLSPKEFKKRYISNGANVKDISKSDQKKKESQYKKDRESAERILNNTDANNKEARKWVEGNKIASRVHWSYVKI